MGTTILVRLVLLLALPFTILISFTALPALIYIDRIGFRRGYEIYWGVFSPFAKNPLDL